MRKTLIEVRNLQKDFKDKTIFKNVTFDISHGDRIGLVGYNGAGKTTLANLLFGSLSPEKGNITFLDPSLKIGYLLQSVDYRSNDFTDILFAQENKELLKKTSQLGLKKITTWTNKRLEHLSGGEKLKLALAKVWSTNPNLLILDEPTNHLDYDGVNWLIEELKNYQGAVLIISHDRYFLDQTVSNIFELEDGKLDIFSGNYTTYRNEKSRRFHEQLHQYENQQKEKERIESQIAKLKNWATKAHNQAGKNGTGSERRQIGLKEYDGVKAKKRDNQVKSKVKRLEKELEKNKVEKPKEDMKVAFQFKTSLKRGKRILEAKNLGKSFEDQTLIKDSYFYVTHGEQIGIIGPNGCGKTTLIQMILSKETISAGELWKSDSLKIAYLSQDVSGLPKDLTPIEFLDLHHAKELFRARTLFANMGMREDKLLKPISKLSLGERTRIKLVKILMNDYDVLILDEPTNHLDLPSREQLEDTLKDFKGTLILVSHDYYFMEKLCDKLLIFENKKIHRVEMSLKEYHNKQTKPIDDTEQKQVELMIINNRITSVLSELSLLGKNDPNYIELDDEFKHLVKKKDELNSEI